MPLVSQDTSFSTFPFLRMRKTIPRTGSLTHSAVIHPGTTFLCRMGTRLQYDRNITHTIDFPPSGRKAGDPTLWNSNDIPAKRGGKRGNGGIGFHEFTLGGVDAPKITKNRNRCPLPNVDGRQRIVALSGFMDPPKTLGKSGEGSVGFGGQSREIKRGSQNY